MHTAILEPRTEPPEVDPPRAALIEEARQRQQRRRALFAFLVLLGSAVAALPFVAGGGSDTKAVGDGFQPLGRLTTTPGPLHTATSVLSVTPEAFAFDPRAGYVDDDYQSGFERLTTTFRAMIETPRVVGEAIHRSHVRRSVDDVTRATEATRGSMPNFIEVSVTDRDADVARRLSNAVSSTFVEMMNEFEPSEPNNLIAIYERAREIP